MNNEEKSRTEDPLESRSGNNDNVTITWLNDIARVQSSLGKPIIQRCAELDDIVKNSSNKDLSSVLPALLENIFGGGVDPGWGLDMISRNQQPHEFEALLYFLGPEGPLMNLVYHLQTDIYLTYDFPFQNLPAPTRHMIEEGSIPMFYVNKLQFQSYTKPVLTLNAFELYMFHFSYTLVSPQWQGKSFNWNNMKEVVYPRLLEEYLKFFLPLNKKSLPKFPQSPNLSVRSPLMQQQQQQQTPISRYSPTSGTQTRSRSRLGLLKASVVSPQKQHGQSSPVHEKAEGEIWWSETFIQVIAEFWLNQNSLDNERGITPQNLSSSWGQPSEPFHSMFESFLPSNNHVRLSRLLLKHLHTFVNSAEPETVISLYPSSDVSPLEEFKRSLIPSFLQKKLYSFFRHSFDRWPLDTSFRLVLEMWLTYIQPWRYLDSQPRKPHDKDHEKDFVKDLWFPFIRDNLLFYTVLMQEFLERSRRSQLTSVYPAYMLFRVSKVFSLPNMSQLLREAEKMMFPMAYRSPHDLSGGSYIAPDISPVLRAQIIELERPDFTYVNLFGKETEVQVFRMLGQIDASICTLRTSESSVQTSNKSFMEYVSSMFESSSKVYGDLTAAEVNKLVQHLEQAKNNFCHFFSVSSEEMSVASSPGRPPIYSLGGAMNQSIHSDQSSFMNQSLTTPSSPVAPDCRLTDEGYQLTPMGRYQLMNGLRKFDIHYRGDPDLQPIRSYENATMVRALYRLSSYVNTHYSEKISSYCKRSGFVGKLSRVYFAPPLACTRTPNSPMSKREMDTLQTPRLSLRFLANYQTLVYLLMFYLFLYMSWGFGLVTYILILMLCVFMYGVLRVILTPSSSSLLSEEDQNTSTLSPIR